jgi:RimJ/RimL family protein N-acetyltransferase
VITVRRLGPGDVDAYANLRLRGLREHPEDFGEDATEHEAMSIDAHRARLAGAAVTLGAFRDDALVGLVGYHRRLDRRKIAHRADVFGTYVAPEARGAGIADALFVALIAHARAQPGLALLALTVRSDNAAAHALYERHGFVAWGTEPHELRVDGTDYAGVHMHCLL